MSVPEYLEKYMIMWGIFYLVLLFKLGAIRKINDDTTLSPLLEQLNESLNEGMNSIRNSVHNIHAKSFDLKSEIQKAIDNYLFCKVIFHYDLSETTPTKVKIAILSIVKEALNNTSKHSNGNLVKIILRDLDRHIQVTISDNGKTKHVGNLGIGLVNIHDRIESLNGIINISNNNGFRIHITIPKET